ncbi:uncharacterized protein LOC134542986 [Bacillus rossius redtenbacheri]|uniref:uncharacterized protein LOC134542986 n=1 Tax=Bacillus rossius redtenbacheri TaxID=93214 RepID=UPI002FDE3D51
MDKEISIDSCTSRRHCESEFGSQTDNVNIDLLPNTSSRNRTFEAFGDFEKAINSVDGVTNDPDPNIQSPEAMGIENAWADDSNSRCSTSDYPIPLPPPGGFEDFGCLDPETPAVEHGPFPESDIGSLFSAETTLQEDVRDPSAQPGVCGLRNLGNTCFMAAGLQCLAATPPLVQFFLRRPASEKDGQLCLTEQFTLLVHKVWTGDFAVLHPAGFKQALGVKHPQFKDYRQHDCQEFLALLLDNLHEQLNTASSKSVLSDVSTSPATPRSQCDASEDARKLLPDAADLESSQQMSCVDGGRYSHSTSSSHSSESSGETRNMFRLQPIPEGVQPFKALSHSDDDMDTELLTNMSGDAAEQEESPVFTQGPSNNLTICNLLHDGPVQSAARPTLEKNNISEDVGTRTPGIYELRDIMKDAKTSNVNVLVTDPEANNEIRFDSEKYPKYEGTRRPHALETANLTEFHDFDGKAVSVKRIKETNLLSAGTGGSECIAQSACCFSNIKRMRLEEQEKNFRMECERKLRHLDESSTGAELCGDEAMPGASGAQPRGSLGDEIEADKHWEKHLSTNQSIIVDTFQGQFKSTVVCAVCKHVSVTYEPFMYLSVPLPHAMERQICVTFVPAGAAELVRYLLTLDKQGKVQDMKDALLKLVDRAGLVPKKVVLAEVLENHIARILDDNSLVRYVNDTNRDIYAFEVIAPLHVKSRPKPEKNAAKEDEPEEESAATGEEFGSRESLPGSVDCAKDDALDQPFVGDERGDGWRSCAICLEVIDTDLRRHPSCNCFLCSSCIDTSCHHSGGDTLQCPMCREMVRPGVDLVPVDTVGKAKPRVRFLNVPLVLRLDIEGDGNNNKKMAKLFGHPRLLRLPNRLAGSDLYSAIGKLVPCHATYTILLVDGQGYRCSRCMYTVHCRGCPVPASGEVLLTNGDTLAVRFTEPFPPECCERTSDHPSMRKQRRHEPLSLYDCLNAFSESEQLDEHNPWYCPICQKNQCATKTLSVWRYPDLLIVYLKRFVFHDGVSMKLDNKVTFPLTGLSVTLQLQHGLPLTYNLYACICHYGGSTAGHYTAYSKNPRTSDWYHFNDETVTKQKPQEEDYSNVYILFYQKQGVSFDLCSPKLFVGEESPKPNIEQLILRLDSSVEQDLQDELRGHSSSPM